MDVACSRCHAEYEFDDALISARGTTVFCTSCGLQFKIFPTAQQRAPEEWTLTPAVPDAVVRTFGSLRELQRAILDGEVEDTDLLARGGERPRALGSIAELEPLLRRPRSAPPPRVEEVPGKVAVSMPGVGLRRTAGGTVMGLAAPRVPNFGAAAPPRGSLPPAAEPTGTEQAAPDSDDAHAVVPSSPTETPGRPEEPWQGAPSQTLRPRIQSVLSRSPAGAPAPDAGPPSSSHLRAALANSAPPSPPGMRGRSLLGPPDSVPEPPASRQSRFDSEPFSVVPGTRARPLARGAWIVVSVLVGATAFVLTAARERVFALFDDGAREESAPHLVSTERAALAAVELADEAWLRVRMASPSERPAKEAALEARLVALEQALDEGGRGPLGRTPAWTGKRVHYLRMKGDVPAARAALGQAKGAPIIDPYLLAMLDLADRSAERPFASILRRLKDASSGERGRYRMRAAYIVALVESGQTELAREDFARLAQNADAQSAVLYGDLARFVNQEPSQELAPADAGPADAPPMPPTAPTQDEPPPPTAPTQDERRRGEAAERPETLAPSETSPSESSPAPEEAPADSASPSAPPTEPAEPAPYVEETTP